MNHYCLDANIFIDPWERDYPPSIFPTLWEKLPKYKENFIIPKNIFDEIDPPNSGLTREERKQKHPLRTWLEENQITPVSVPREIQKLSLLLEKKYQIRPKISKGANQNDLLLITYAKENQKTLVTLESRQPNPPKRLSDYKIPLICIKEGVDCIDYIQFLEKLKISI